MQRLDYMITIGIGNISIYLLSHRVIQVYWISMYKFPVNPCAIWTAGVNNIASEKTRI
jgi:hypothetical protein